MTMATITEQIDALIANDALPLALARHEIAAALTHSGWLASAVIAEPSRGDDLPAGTARHVGSALYSLLRAARALDMDIEATLLAEIDSRNRINLQLDAHLDRIGAAAIRARSA